MIIKKELIKREIAGDTILVPVGSTMYDSNGLFMLNELGGFIWDLLPAMNSEEEICQAVLDAYEVSEEIARADVAAFIGQLKEMGIL